MTFSRIQFLLAGAASVIVAALRAASGRLPALGAGALLHPIRHHVDAAPPEGCSETAFSGAGVNLAGWKCRAAEGRRATLIFLHGVADNRVSGVGAIQRF